MAAAAVPSAPKSRKPAAAAPADKKSGEPTAVGAEPEPFNISAYTAAGARDAAKEIDIDLTTVPDKDIPKVLIERSRHMLRGSTVKFWFCIGIALSMTPEAPRELSDRMRVLGLEPRDANAFKNAKAALLFACAVDTDSFSLIVDHNVTWTTIRNLMCSNTTRASDVIAALLEAVDKKMKIKSAKDACGNVPSGLEHRWVPLKYQPQTTAERHAAKHPDADAEEALQDEPAEDEDEDEETETPSSPRQSSPVKVKDKKDKKEKDKDKEKDKEVPKRNNNKRKRADPADRKADDDRRPLPKKKTKKKQTKPDEDQEPRMEFDTTENETETESAASAGSGASQRRKRVKLNPREKATMYPKLMDMSVVNVINELGISWEPDFAAPYVLKNFADLSDDPLLVAERHPSAFTRATRIAMPERNLTPEQLQAFLPRDGDIVEYTCYTGPAAAAALKSLTEMARKACNEEFERDQHAGSRRQQRRTDVQAKGELGKHMEKHPDVLVGNLKAAGVADDIMLTRRQIRAYGATASAAAAAVREEEAKDYENTRCLYYTDRTVKPEADVTKLLMDLIHPFLATGGIQRYTTKPDAYHFHKHKKEIADIPELGRPSAFATPVAYLLEYTSDAEQKARGTDRYHRGDAHHEALRQLSVNVQTRHGIASTVWATPVNTQANLQRLVNAYLAFGIDYSPDSVEGQLNVPLEALVLLGVQFTIAVQQEGVAVVTGYAAAHAVWTAPGAIKYATNVVTYDSLASAIRYFSKRKASYRAEARKTADKSRLVWAPHIAADPFGYACDVAVAEARALKSKTLNPEAVRAVVLAASDQLLAPPPRAPKIMQQLMQLYPRTPQFAPPPR